MALCPAQTVSRPPPARLWHRAFIPAALRRTPVFVTPAQVGGRSQHPVAALLLHARLYLGAAQPSTHGGAEGRAWLEQPGGCKARDWPARAGINCLGGEVATKLYSVDTPTSCVSRGTWSGGERVWSATSGRTCWSRNRRHLGDPLNLGIPSACWGLVSQDIGMHHKDRRTDDTCRCCFRYHVRRRRMRTRSGSRSCCTERR